MRSTATLPLPLLSNRPYSLLSSNRPYSLLSLPHRPFSIISNQPMEVVQMAELRQKVYDVNLLHYDWLNQAVAEKRYTTKAEVPSKIHIIEPPRHEPLLAQLLRQQVDWADSMDSHEGNRRAQEGTLDAHYLRAVMGEPHLNSLLQEYQAKVPLNGYTPSLEHLQAQEQTEKQVMGLYHTFFRGDQLSSLEYLLHLRYLSCKHQKHKRFIKIKEDKDYKKNEKMLYSCVWTQENQRRINFRENYPIKDLRLYDDYRPIFRPVDFSAYPMYQVLLKGLESMKSAKEEAKLCQANNLFQFTREYVYSIEVSNGLELMPDHQMEYALLHAHLWLIMDRLQTVQHQASSLPSHYYMSSPKEVLQLRAQLLRTLQSHLHGSDVQLHSRNIDYTLAHHRRILPTIFSAEPSLIRTLLTEFVYKDILLGRTKANNKSVLLISEYLLRQHEYLQTVSLECMVSGAVEWDVHRVPLGYEQYYAQNKSALAGLDSLPRESLIRVTPPSLIWAAMKHWVYSVARKFNTLQSYDHFSILEQKEKDMEAKREKYIWK